MKHNGSSLALKRSKAAYSFSLKFSQSEQEQILNLSRRMRKPASKVIVLLVTQELKKSPSASELRRLPAKERSRILTQQAKHAAKMFALGEEEILPDDMAGWSNSLPQR